MPTNPSHYDTPVYRSAVQNEQEDNNELTIVIPAKNEAANIGKLLDSLAQQDYDKISTTQIFVADANSTDATRQIVQSFYGKLNISIIPGGLPAVGRNNGANRATTRYVLFIDADVTLSGKTIIREALAMANEKNLDCLGAYLACPTGELINRAMYFTGNILQKLLLPFIPTAVGTFLLFRREKFLELGGFNERITYGEDFFLTKLVPRAKFDMLKQKIEVGDRQFKRGYGKVIRLYISLVAYRNHPKYFYRDHGYWKS
jgi:glycosyltransferase involved in cell wall biosynthesis